jgi:Xaa-Pro dipeptidase
VKALSFSLGGDVSLLNNVTRRHFFWNAAATAAGGALLATRATAMEQEKLPPAVAALPNLASLARPFTNAERQARIERARERMAAAKIDAVVLANGSVSARYFANLNLWGGERLWALVLARTGKPFLICPAFEAGRAHEVLALGPLANEAEVRVWQEDESPYALLDKTLAARGLATGTVGLDENLKFFFYEGIAKAAPGLKLVSASPVTAGCRMVKEPHELECQRLAGRATLLVYRAVAQSVRPGMTSRDVESLVGQAYKQVGFEGDASLNIDEFTAQPHGSEAMQTLREGSILMLDDGCEVEGYTSDLTRTFVLGKPTDKMRRVFDTVRRMQSAAVSAARPGAMAASVDRAARRVAEEAGYGAGFERFTHRLGHGIGLEMHEWPYFVDHNMFGWETEHRLEAGNVLSDEPGIYLPGEFGIRLEDELHVTADGAELLTPQSPSLDDPFAGVA